MRRAPGIPPPAPGAAPASPTARVDGVGKQVLTVRDVQLFLGKSKRGFYLLRSRSAEGFPAPFLINGRDHWLTTDIIDWIATRRRSCATPGQRTLRASSIPQG